MDFVLSQTRSTVCLALCVTQGLQDGAGDPLPVPKLQFQHFQVIPSVALQGPAVQGAAGPGPSTAPRNSGHGIKICGIKAPSGLEIHEPIYQPPLADLPSEQD